MAENIDLKGTWVEMGKGSEAHDKHIRLAHIDPHSIEGYHDPDPSELLAARAAWNAYHKAMEGCGVDWVEPTDENWRGLSNREVRSWIAASIAYLPRAIAVKGSILRALQQLKEGLETRDVYWCHRDEAIQCQNRLKEALFWAIEASGE